MNKSKKTPEQEEETPEEEKSEDVDQPNDDPAKVPAPADEVSEREVQLQTELLETRSQLAA